MTKNDELINKLFNELVPRSGKADSLAGELVRAITRLGFRFYGDGDRLGIGYGNETCNAAGRFLIAKGSDEIEHLTARAWEAADDETYDELLNEIEGAVVRYIEHNPDLRQQPTEDMWSYFNDEEDVDDSDSNWDSEESSYYE